MNCKGTPIKGGVEIIGVAVLQSRVAFLQKQEFPHPTTGFTSRTQPKEKSTGRTSKKKAIPSGERPRLHYSIEGMFLFNVNDQNGAPGVTKVHKSVGGGMNREFRLRTASGHVGQGKHNNWAERISSTCVPVLQYGRLSTAVPACEYCSICQLIQDKRLVNIRNPQLIMERLPPPTDL